MAIETNGELWRGQVDGWIAAGTASNTLWFPMTIARERTVSVAEAIKGAIVNGGKWNPESFNEAYRPGEEGFRFVFKGDASGSLFHSVGFWGATHPHLDLPGVFRPDVLATPQDKLSERYRTNRLQLRRDGLEVVLDPEKVGVPVDEFWRVIVVRAAPYIPDNILKSEDPNRFVAEVVAKAVDPSEAAMRLEVTQAKARLEGVRHRIVRASRPG